MTHSQNGNNGSSERPQDSDLASRENGIPKGLSRCRACGDWKGRCLWPQPPLRHPTLTRIRCRCEAEICKKCGEPTWEYKPDSYFYCEATGEIQHVPNTAGSQHCCGWPRIQLPCPIEPDWNEKWGPLLAGFPVQLVYRGIRRRNDDTRRPIVARANYFFDPGSFLEDDSKKQMRYIPRLPSDYYVDVVWKKQDECWETSKFKGDRLIAVADGNTFEGAMIHTLLIGLQPDEPTT